MAPEARLLLTGGEIRAGVDRLAAQLAATYDGEVVLAAVLPGTLLFVADLVRRLGGTPTVEFLAVTPYAPASDRVRLRHDLRHDVTDRHVVLVEDLVDTGLTSAFLQAEVARRGPASVQVCTLLDRPARRILPTPLRFVGFEIPDEDVVGYGLDWHGRYGNLDLLAAVDAEVLAADPDAYVEQLYRRSPHRDV